jgi:hypothetical protein
MASPDSKDSVGFKYDHSHFLEAMRRSVSESYKTFAIKNINIPNSESIFSENELGENTKSRSDFHVSSSLTLFNTDYIVDLPAASPVESNNLVIKVTSTPKAAPLPIGNEFDSFFYEFSSSAKREPLEYGMYSACDQLLENWLTRYPSEFSAIIHHIYIKSINNKTVLITLLKALSGLPYSAAHPSGLVAAMAATAHKSIEVKEAGIRAFENWGHEDCISILEHIDTPLPWLNDYRLKTIEYIKSINEPNQKN